MDPIDQRLAALLAAPLGQADASFVHRVTQAALVERRVRELERRGRVRFLIELVGTASVLLALVMISIATGGDQGPLDQPASAPALAAALGLGLWMIWGCRGRSGASG